MHAFDVLGAPVRRRVLELLADGEHSSGAIVDAIQAEFGISQAAVSQHLRILRECGFASVRIDGPRRMYSVGPPLSRRWTRGWTACAASGSRSSTRRRPRSLGQRRSGETGRFCPLQWTRPDPTKRWSSRSASIRGARVSGFGVRVAVSPTGPRRNSQKPGARVIRGLPASAPPGTRTPNLLIKSQLL